MENRVQARYWREFVELKVACEYFRGYRDSLGQQIRRFAAGRAIVSAGAVAAWVTTHASPQLWASSVMAAQVSEAVQQSRPIEAWRAGLNDLCPVIDALFIETQLEWEEIASGNLTEEEITRRWGRLKHRRLAAEGKALPSGLPRRNRLIRVAAAEAQAYMTAVYSSQETNDGRPGVAAPS